MHDEDHQDYFLSRREIAEILEPIRDHGHCWSAIASQMLRTERIRRIRLEQQRKQLGPYGDWPKDGH